MDLYFQISYYKLRHADQREEHNSTTSLSAEWIEPNQAQKHKSTCYSQKQQHIAESKHEILDTAPTREQAQSISYSDLEKAQTTEWIAPPSPGW